MAPRGLSAEEKRVKLLEIFHESRGFYQLKELEKLGPKLKGIVSQSVKDVLQSLVDDGLVQGDKIGSSNFFWSFPSQKGSIIRARLSKARDATTNLKTQLEDTRACIASEQTLRKETASASHLQERLDPNQQQAERSQALQDYTKLTEELAELERELEGFGDADPMKYEESKRAVILSKEAALRWTDNYNVLLGYFCRERTVDPEEIRRHFGVPEDYEDIY